MNDQSKCPFMHGSQTTPVSGTDNKDWWPNNLNLDILRQHDAKSNPNDSDFDYKEAVKALNVDAIKADLKKVMTRLAGLVASLIMVIMVRFHSHDLACGRHLSYR